MRDAIYLEKKKEYGFIKLLNWSHVEEAFGLRRKVSEGIVDKTLFASAAKEDFIKVIEDGFGLVCIANGVIIACLLCILEDVEYGNDMQYPEDELKQCADYLDVFVDPEYRGNGLQSQLEEFMAHLCRKNGKYIILGTVSPNNKYSFENFKKDGYKEVARMKKYGGLDRIFMEKRLVVE